MTETMTIGEVARRAGLRPSAIRYYESEQVLPPPRLVHTKRRYTADIFPRLALIRIAQEAGLTIDEMRLVLNNQQGGEQFPGGWRELARQKLLEAERRTQQIARMKYILEEALRKDLSAEEALHLFQPSLSNETPENEV